MSEGVPVYLVPATFGFGPAALATAVARWLRQHHPEVPVFGVGDGIAHDFLRDSGLFGDRLLLAEVDGLPDAVGRDPRAVTVFFGDFDRPLVARERGLRTVVVDALYWMWTADPLRPDLVDRYLALAFPGVAERIAAQGAPARGIRLVSQIVDEMPDAAPAARSGTVLNFGGAMSPMGGNHTYLRALIDVVTEVVGDPDGITVTCSSGAADAIRRLGAPVRARIADLPFDEMMRTLATSERLVTLPGQSIMWEVLRAGVPTVVLPGANYSHHRQVGSYQQFFADVPFITWDRLDGYETLPAGLSEDKGVARAVELGTRFATDAAARETLKALLREAIDRPAKAPTLRPGNPWSSFDGAAQVGREVLALAGQAR
ncbi:hypothetical protein Val02_88060 [Virgisporangium aliadipatigenens]|uniref:Uncharacterized protein n=1 Tax=Virgisporangium aliadipatigenens TaxID=741659 RepID=A0A8J3YYA1_9ACTN|nr:hypothetical protein [Virgisporangium aliadipatigenens]GIJ51920.1 hypothetical protein Val02_88060 [Virgisporangium aliadipatigenens]